MDRDRLQFWILYLAIFASSFGFVTLVTLLATFITLFEATGLLAGLFVTALTLARTVAVVPLAWVGDRGDKRAVLLAGLGLGVLVYVAFALVGSPEAFLAARFVQGVSLTATGLMTLSLVGERSPPDGRANNIGKANAARMAAGIGGSLSAGGLYAVAGGEAVFGLLAGLMAVAFVGAWVVLEPDDTTVAGNPFRDLALNRRILTLTSFRAQYAVAVTLVRNWVPIYAGVTAAEGGLAYGTFAVGAVVTAEKATNMLCQPVTGRLSDRHGRAAFVFVGGTTYGLLALAVPFAPAVGDALGSPAAVPVFGAVSAAFLPLLALNAGLGVADSLREPASMALFADEGTGSGVASSFGIRGLVWRPGSVVAPVLAGLLWDAGGIEWVFYAGGGAALLAGATFVVVLATQFGTRALAAW